MLLDAARAEAYRLSKNRTTVFWAVLFVPILYVVAGLLVLIVAKANVGPNTALSAQLLEVTAPMNIGPELVGAVSQVDNVAVLAFSLIAAATLFAGDYRWETWRLISARNSRVNLLGGKILTLLGLSLAISLIFTLAASIIVVASPLIGGRGISLSLDGSQGLQMGGLYLIGLARLVQFLLLSLLAATVTRSLLVALFVPVVVSFAQGFGQNAVMIFKIGPTDWQAIFLSPGLAARHLKEAVMNEAVGSALLGVVGVSLTSLVAWIVVPILLSVVIFQRQGLSKE